MPSRFPRDLTFVSHRPSPGHNGLVSRDSTGLAMPGTLELGQPIE